VGTAMVGMAKLTSATAMLTTVTSGGWPVALIGIWLITLISVMLAWTLGSRERTRRLVSIIRAIRPIRTSSTSKRKDRSGPEPLSPALPPSDQDRRRPRAIDHEEGGAEDS
jgi:hypothetical protein